MDSKVAAAGEELRKLQQIAEHTEEWASKVTSFLVVTQDLCKSAAHVLCHIDDDAFELQKVLVDGAETVANAVDRVVKLARLKSTEVVNEFQAKGRNWSLRELKANVEQASLAVGIAIFETLQLQADEFGKLADKSIAACKKSATSLGQKLPLSPSPRYMDKSNGNGVFKDRSQSFEGYGILADATPTSDVDLDWAAFEEDLKGLANTVDGEMHSAEEELAEVEFLKGKVRKLEKARSDAVTRAEHAESAADEALRRVEHAESAAEEALQKACQAESMVSDLRREKEVLEYSQSDDRQEIMGALKREQLARLSAEQKLKAAENDARSARDDLSAATLALEMTKKVAASLVGGGGGSDAPSVSSAGGAASETRLSGRSATAHLQTTDGTRQDGHSDVESETTDVILSKSASQHNLNVTGVLQERNSFDGHLQGSDRGMDPDGAGSAYCVQNEALSTEPLVMQPDGLNPLNPMPKPKSSSHGDDRSNPFGDHAIHASSRHSGPDDDILPNSRSFENIQVHHVSTEGRVSPGFPPNHSSTSASNRSSPEGVQNPFQDTREEHVNPFQAPDDTIGREPTLALQSDVTYQPPSQTTDGRDTSNPFETLFENQNDKKEGSYQNPFDAEPRPPATTDGMNPFMTPVRQQDSDRVPITKSSVRHDSRSADQAGKDTNPFMTLSNSKAPGREAATDGTSLPDKDGWNPFSPRGENTKNPADGGEWNPFSGGGGPKPVGDWNPFS